MEFEVILNDVIPRTHDVKSFRFNKPEGFDYLAGQYIMVSVSVDGTVLKKPLTISSSPLDEDLEFTKKLTGHEFSNALDSLNAGDSFTIDGPYGKLTFEGEYDKIALISGGIGITPMISICKNCTDQKAPFDIVLIASNKTEEDIAFRKELEQMESENPHLRVVHTLTRADDSWKGCREHICENMILKEIPDYKERVFYLCGPPGMVKAVKELLVEMDIPKSMMKIELITGY
ncbi:ferredoxin--NADP reductase [Methanohalophilus levihalophilus]|uniref:ferredoxin--NADP reductase n=1 Tax=Methanohalophilus levihalophilus TaxID=1431282 RepID=UPI001AE6B472|nr:FAD-binding oxidoreductase [Methanohalophilus levihalophilus]